MDREIIKIAVSVQAKTAIERICQRYGMTQIELASRCYIWFAEQEEVVQAAVLGILPDAVAADVARMVLKRLADAPKDGVASPASTEPVVPAPLSAEAQRKVKPRRTSR
jgi:hypothetical protein